MYQHRETTLIKSSHYDTLATVTRIRNTQTDESFVKAVNEPEAWPTALQLKMKP